jgi:hypothetical protein
MVLKADPFSALSYLWCCRREQTHTIDQVKDAAPIWCVANHRAPGGTALHLSKFDLRYGGKAGDHPVTEDISIVFCARRFFAR